VKAPAAVVQLSHGIRNDGISLVLVAALAVWILGGLLLGLPVAGLMIVTGLAISAGLLAFALLCIFAWAAIALWGLRWYVRHRQNNPPVSWRRDVVVWFSTCLVIMGLQWAATSTNLVAWMLEPDYTAERAENLRAATDPADLVAYLERYPQGKYVTLARRRMLNIELLYWKSVLADPQGMKWELYLRAYPDGPHHTEARRLLEGQVSSTSSPNSQ
jgi:hypothetical protein